MNGHPLHIFTILSSYFISNKFDTILQQKKLKLHNCKQDYDQLYRVFHDGILNTCSILNYSHWIQILQSDFGIVWLPHMWCLKYVDII